MIKQPSKLSQLLGIFLMICSGWSTVDAKELSMVTVDWAPYYGSEMEGGGVITVLAQAAFQLKGYKATVTFVPWKRALNKVLLGEKDVLLGAYFTKQRAKDYAFSDPFYDVEVGLVALQSLGVTHYSKLEELKPYTIGVSRGWAYSEEFDTAEYLNKEDATNQIFNIRKLFKNRIDLMAVAFGIFRYEVSKLKTFTLKDVVFIQPPLQTSSLHLMMSLQKPGHEKILEDFNEGLAEIRANGTYDQILEKFGFLMDLQAEL